MKQNKENVKKKKNRAELVYERGRWKIRKTLKQTDGEAMK